jgi:hypothetical protein
MTPKCPKISLPWPVLEMGPNGEDCIPDHAVDRGFGETAVEKVVSVLVNRVMPDGAALLAKAHWEHRQANFVLLEPTNLLPDHPLCCSANILSK